MTTTEIILSIISVISSLLAIYSFIRAELRKAKERANVEILREKLKAIYNGFESLFYSTDAIVQLSKNREAKVEELQNIARVLRGQIYVLSKSIENTTNQLDKWKFGVMIESDERLDDLQRSIQKGESGVA